MAASTRRRLEGQRGQALPLVVGIVALAALGVVALGRFAVGTVDAARARTAADAAALAGAADGRGAAAAVAAANGAALVSFTERDDAVIVEVRVGKAVARARAELVLARPP
jgi:hypothetical protein